jgi:hypothetical protein
MQNGGGRKAPSPALRTMTLALAFNPIFIYVAVAISGIVALARLLLGWAMRA